jgi:5,10-methylenetetrahydromethanopterin reductase
VSATRLGLLFLGRRPAARFAEVARHAERAGFDIFWIPDERFFREVYSLCTVVALATERMRVGPCVTDPYTRHPALTAMAIATLDELSGGRAVLGLGAGVSGFAELGLTRRQPARAVGESIRLLRGLLSGQSAVSDALLPFMGRLDFQPIRADIPIYVAAAGPRMLEMSGALADGVIAEGCMADAVLRDALAHVRHGAQAAGRDPAALDVVARIDVAVDASLERAYDALRPRVARHLINAAPTFERFTHRGLEVPSDLRELAAGLGYTHDPAVLAPVAAHITDAYIDAFCIAATPESLPARLRWLVERGVTQIIVNPIAVRGDEVEPVIETVGKWSRWLRAADGGG